MTTTKWPWWVTVSLLLTVVLSLVNIFPRYQAEQANRAVGIVVETDVVDELAASQGLTFSEGLVKLSEATGGQAGGLILSSNETTAGEWLSNSLIQMSRLPDGSFEVYGGEYEMSMVRQAWAARFGSVKETENGIEINNPNLLRTLPVGLPRRDFIEAHNMGYPLLARLGNPNGANLPYIQFALSALKANGVGDFYLPLGDQVMGAPGLIGETSDLLKELKIQYVTAEFVKTVGDSSMALKEPENTVRLHAAQSAELVRMSKPTIVERYVKAARERNIRLLLIRPAITASDHALDDFAGLIASIRVGLEKEGMAVRMPRPYVAPNTSPVMMGLLGLAMMPALGFALVCLAGMFGWDKPIWFYGLGGVLGLMVNLSSTREIATLASAVLMPILAYYWYFQKPDRPVWVSYLGLSGISVVGGLPVAGLLVGIPYMMHLDIFTGVKVAVFLPVFVVAFMALQRMTNWREAMKQPIVWGSAFTAIFVLLVLGFMYMRTGNDNPAAVSGLELKLRDLLDRWLVVRPRTKEFMIGHPALLIGLGIWNRTTDARWRAIGGFLLVIGAIGQTSIVNTLCHLHTPIHLSIIRIGIGLIFGCILGVLGWVIVSRFVPRSSGDEQ